MDASGFVRLHSACRHQPAYRGGFYATEIVLNAHRQVRVVSIWILFQQLLGQGRSLFRITDGGQIALLNQRCVIGSQPEGEDLRKLRVRIVGILRQSLRRQAVCLIQFRVDHVFYLRVRVKLLSVVESVLVGEKLRLQHAEPREFCEQMSRSLTGGPHRVLGMQLLPSREILMSRREIEVVHARKTLPIGVAARPLASAPQSAGLSSASSNETENNR